MSVWWEVQKAVYGRLDEDMTLNALVTGVYDHVPEYTALPYITLGHPQSTDISLVSRVISEIQLPIQLWSQAFGKRQNFEILDRVFTLLHQQPLTVGEGYNCLSMAVTGTRTEIQDIAGSLYMTTVSLQITMEHG